MPPTSSEFYRDLDTSWRDLSRLWRLSGSFRSYAARPFSLLRKLSSVSSLEHPRCVFRRSIQQTWLRYDFRNTQRHLSGIYSEFQCRSAWPILITTLAFPRWKNQGVFCRHSILRTRFTLGFPQAPSIGKFFASSSDVPELCTCRSFVGDISIVRKPFGVFVVVQ